MGYNDYAEVRDPDPYGEYSVQEIVDGAPIEDARELEDLRDTPTVEYAGFHIIPHSSTEGLNNDEAYLLQPDGHAGIFRRLDPDKLETPAQFVETLQRLSQLFWHEYTREGRISEGGRLLTGDEERAEAHPDEYLFVPPEAERIE